jgi:putative ABC transport system permease protein
MTLLVRSESDPRPLVAALRQEIAHLDPDIAISGVQSLDEVVAGSVAQPQLIMRVVSVFAALALVLASIGIYGVMTYSVAERTREIGVRMALGAGPADILGLVLKEGLGLTLAGVGLGLAASLGFTRLLGSLLFGVSATDPLTFAAAAVVLAATALLACYVPAHRGMRLQPIRALRED